MAVKEYPQPKSKRAFLGLVGYYRKFIPQFASWAADMTKKRVKVFEWTDEADRAFQYLQTSLSCTEI